MKIRIIKDGSTYFVDYQLSDKSWKNYSSHATQTEAMKEKTRLLNVVSDSSMHELFDGSNPDLLGE